MTGTVLLILRVVMVAALYAFLVWALWTLWQSLAQQRQQLAARKIPPLHLAVREDEDIEILIFQVPVVTIGRDQACECVLESETVSARHARLVYHHKQWWLEDLKATNGTFLNNDRVQSGLVVAVGDEIRCGEAVLEVALPTPRE